MLINPTVPSIAAGSSLTAVIVEAATGVIPERLQDAPRAQKNPYKGHASQWFKSVDGGRELARKVRDLGIWNAHLQARFEPFLQAVITAQEDLPARVPHLAP